MHQLFIDMETLVTDQAVAFDAIEESTQQVDINLEQGNKEVDIAIVHAHSARKKKWICMIISIVILAIIIIVVLIQVG